MTPWPPPLSLTNPWPLQVLPVLTIVTSCDYQHLGWDGGGGGGREILQLIDSFSTTPFLIERWPVVKHYTHLHLSHCSVICSNNSDVWKPRFTTQDAWRGWKTYSSVGCQYCKCQVQGICHFGNNALYAGFQCRMSFLLDLLIQSLTKMIVHVICSWPLKLEESRDSQEFGDCGS